MSLRAGFFFLISIFVTYLSWKKSRNYLHSGERVLAHCMPHMLPVYTMLPRSMYVWSVLIGCVIAARFSRVEMLPSLQSHVKLRAVLCCVCIAGFGRVFLCEVSMLLSTCQNVISVPVF